MGEANKRRQTFAEILKNEPRCIYCDKPATSIEHMPPVGIFKDKHRYNGLEFASCIECNVGTKAADIAGAVASFISRPGETEPWHLKQLNRLVHALEINAPGVREELTDHERISKNWMFTPSGLIEPAYYLNGTGPILTRLLDVFSAKLGMSLFREHTGAAVPVDGKTYFRWFLNAGIFQSQIEEIISILPGKGTLRQGRQFAHSQFTYRYNTDGKEICAVLAGFHNNLHIFMISVSGIDAYSEGFSLGGEYMKSIAPGFLVNYINE